MLYVLCLRIETADQLIPYGYTVHPSPPEAKLWDNDRALPPGIVPDIPEPSVLRIVDRGIILDPSPAFFCTVIRAGTGLFLQNLPPEENYVSLQDMRLRRVA